MLFIYCILLTEDYFTSGILSHFTIKNTSKWHKVTSFFLFLKLSIRAFFFINKIWSNLIKFYRFGLGIFIYFVYVQKSFNFWCSIYFYLSMYAFFQFFSVCTRILSCHVVLLKHFNWMLVCCFENNNFISYVGQNAFLVFEKNSGLKPVLIEKQVLSLQP